MSEKLKEMSVAAFVDLTASDAPAPGGGSVSALFGALSAALTGMVAGLTVGKKKYVEVEAEMREVAAAAEALKKELVEEIDRDSDSFNEFMAAMAARTAVIGAGLNVKINLASIEDEDFVAEYSARVAALEEQAIAAEREIFALSELTREI